MHVLEYLHRNVKTPKDGTVQKPDTRFDDVAKSAWYYKAVEYLAQNGIMSGVSAREFAPNAGFSRAMLAQTPYAVSGKPTVKAEGTFDIIIQTFSEVFCSFL